MNRLMPAMRVLVAVVILAGQALLAACAPAYQGTVWLDEYFDASPTVWTSNCYDAAVGSHNRFTSMAGGVDGNALRVSIPAGFVNYGRSKLPGAAGLCASSGRNGIKLTDANPEVVGAHGFPSNL